LKLLPINYLDPGEQRKKIPRYKDRISEYNSRWYEIENPEALDGWALVNGFSSLEDVYRDVSFETVAKLLDAVPFVEDALEGKRYKGKISLRGTIEVVRSHLTSQIYAEEQIAKGRELIKRHLPQFAPRESTVVVGVPNFNPVGENGEYLGKFDKSHVIYIYAPKDPYFDPYEAVTEREVRVCDSVLGAHELMHQKHAEIHSGVGYKDEDENTVSIEFIKRNRKQKVLERIDRNDEEAGENIQATLAEGIATAAELYIAYRERQRLVALGREEEASVFTKAIRWRLEFLKTPRAEAKAYQDGVLRLVRKLYDDYGLDRTGEIIEKVDFAGCAKIKYGSEEYKRVLGNPMLLPGLV